MKKVFFGLIFLSLPLCAMQRYQSDMPSDSMVWNAALRFASGNTAKPHRQEAIRAVLREIPSRDLEDVVSWTLELLPKLKQGTDKLEALKFLRGIASEDRSSVMTGLMYFLKPHLSLREADKISEEVLKVPSSERTNLWAWTRKFLQSFGDQCFYGPEDIRYLGAIPASDRESILFMSHEFFGKREGGIYRGEIEDCIKTALTIPPPLRLLMGVQLRDPFVQRLGSQDKLAFLRALITLGVDEGKKLIQQLESCRGKTSRISVWSLVGSLVGPNGLLDGERFEYGLSLLTGKGEEALHDLKELRDLTPSQKEALSHYRQILGFLSPKVPVKEAFDCVYALPQASREGLHDFCAAFLRDQKITKNSLELLAAIPISERQELIVQKDSLMGYAGNGTLFSGEEKGLRAFLTLSSTERVCFIPFLRLLLGVTKDHSDIESFIKDIQKIPGEDFEDLFSLVKNVLENTTERDLSAYKVRYILEDFLEIYPLDRISVAKNLKRLGLEERPKEVALIPCDERDEIVDSLVYLKETIKEKGYSFRDMMSQIQEMVVKDFPHNKRHNFCKILAALINLFKMGEYSEFDNIVSTALQLSPELGEKFVESLEKFFSRPDYQEAHEGFLERLNSARYERYSSPTPQDISTGDGIVDTLDGVKEVWAILNKEKMEQDWGGHHSRYDHWRQEDRTSQRILKFKLQDSATQQISDFLQRPLEEIEDLENQLKAQDMALLLDTLSPSSRESIQRNILRLTQSMGPFGLGTLRALIEKLRLIPATDRDEVVSYSLPLMTESVVKKDQQVSVLDMVAKIRPEERAEVLRYVTPLISPTMVLSEIEDLLKAVRGVDAADRENVTTLTGQFHVDTAGCDKTMGVLVKELSQVALGERPKYLGLTRSLMNKSMRRYDVDSLLKEIRILGEDKRQAVVDATKSFLKALGTSSLPTVGDMVKKIGSFSPEEFQDLMLEGVPHLIGGLTPMLIQRQGEGIVDLLKSILKISKEEREAVVKWAFRLMPPEAINSRNMPFHQSSFSSSYGELMAKITSLSSLERDEILEGVAQLNRIAKKNVEANAQEVTNMMEKIRKIDPSERKEVLELSCHLITPQMGNYEIFQIIDRVMQYGRKEEDAGSSHLRPFYRGPQAQVKILPQDRRDFLECVGRIFTPNMKFHEVDGILKTVERLERGEWEELLHLTRQFLAPAVSRSYNDSRSVIDVMEKIQKIESSERKEIVELASGLITSQMGNHESFRIVDRLIQYGTQAKTPGNYDIFRTSRVETQVKFSKPNRRHFVDCVARLLTSNMGFQELEGIMATLEKLARNKWEDLVKITLRFLRPAALELKVSSPYGVFGLPPTRSQADRLGVVEMIKKIQTVEPSEWEELLELSSRVMTAHMDNHDRSKILEMIIEYCRATALRSAIIPLENRRHFVDCAEKLITPSMRYQDVLSIWNALVRLDPNEWEGAVGFALQFVTEVMSGSNHERGHLLACFQGMRPGERQDMISLMGQLVTSTMPHHDRFQILERLRQVNPEERRTLVNRVTERLSEDVIHHGMLEGDRFQRIIQLLADPQAPFQRRVIEVTGEEALIRMQGDLEKAFYALTQGPQASAFVRECLPKSRRFFPAQCAVFNRGLDLALRIEKSESIKFRIQKAAQGLKRLAYNIREDFRIRQMPSIRRLFGLVYTALNYGFMPETFAKTWISEKNAADSHFLPNFKAAFFHRFPSLMSFDTLGIILEEDEARGGQLLQVLASLIKDPIYLQFWEHVIVKELTKNYIRSFMARNVPLVEALMMSMRGHNRNILDAREQDNPACVDGVYTGLLLALREVKETGDIVAPLLSGIEVLKCS